MKGSRAYTFTFQLYSLLTIIIAIKSRNMITSFLCTSTVYKFVSILDDTLDLLHWGWVGGWTEELESALMELLVAVNDEFVEFIRKLNSLISMMGSSSGYVNYFITRVVFTCHNVLTST